MRMKEVERNSQLLNFYAFFINKGNIHAYKKSMNNKERTRKEKYDI